MAVSKIVTRSLSNIFATHGAKHEHFFLSLIISEKR